MTVQHTPGPWTGESDLPYNRMPRIHGADQSLICEVGNLGTEQDQWEANAALIAAAPDLLLVALRVAEWMRAVDAGDEDLEYLNGEGWNDIAETAEMARAAVARAKGEACHAY